MNEKNKPKKPSQSSIEKEDEDTTNKKKEGLAVPANEARKAMKYKKIHVESPLLFASTGEAKEPEVSVDDVAPFGSKAEDEAFLVRASKELDPHLQSGERKAARSHSHSGEPELWEEVVVMRSKDEAETNDVEVGREQENLEGLPTCPSDSPTPPAVSHPQARPGAYRYHLGSGGVPERVSSAADIEEQPSRSRSIDRTSEVITVEAKLVVEQENDPIFRRKRQIFCMVAIVVIVVVVGVVVGAVVIKRSNPDSMASAFGSMNPTMAPTPTVTDPVVALLGSSVSEETISAVHTPSTPQNKAFQWLTSQEQNISSSSSSAMRMPQRFALATLFYATNGDSWNHSAGWLRPSVHECDWFGCNCTKQGLIRSVELERNGLSDMLPQELSLLSTELEVLNLWENPLTGSIPSDLAKLSKLANLVLKTTMLRGTIPSALGSLTKLELLLLDENALTGSIPSELGKLSKLTYLYLHTNELIGTVPPELGNLINLEALYLSDNAFTGSIPSELAKLSVLTELSLKENELIGRIPSQLGDLTNLQELYLWGNVLTSSIPWELSKLSSTLTEIELAYNKLSGTIPSELGNLTNLEYLSFFDNYLTGPIPTEFGKISRLTHLMLDTNQLNQNIPTEFGALDNMQFLHLYDNRLSGTIPSELGILSSLTELFVHGNQLSGEMPVEICVLALNGLNVSIDCDRVQQGLFCDCMCL